VTTLVPTIVQEKVQKNLRAMAGIQICLQSRAQYSLESCRETWVLNQQSASAW